MEKIKPLKRLGQNFLVDRGVVKKILKTADIKPQDIVLEIGPGFGALTQGLAKRAKKVIAVEKDRRMCEVLKENFKGFKNIEIINQDVLKITNYQLQTIPLRGISRRETNYKLIANLPFYITAPTIRKFLESEVSPEEMVLIIQKEVAQRICAKPPQMSILAVSVQFYAKPEIIYYVSKKSFWPQPKVDGAIIKIVPHKKYNINKDLFFKIVKAGFSHPRKQLANNLAKMLKLDKHKVNKRLLQNNIQPSQRAETLTIDDWIKLSKVI